MATRSSGGRPPANAALRGGLLIVLAVVIGVALMSWGFADEGGLLATDDPETTEPADPDTDDPETTEPADPDTDTTDPGDGDTQDPGDVLPPPRDPSEVGTLVLNGTDVNGAAGRVTQELSGLNYNVRSPDDVPGDDPIAETRIYHLEEWRAEAVRVAEELNVSTDVVAPMPVPTPFGAELGEASILIVLGEDQLISAAAAG